MSKNVPQVIVEATAVELIKGVIDCCKEITICSEREKTERYKIDKHMELYLAQIQSNADKFSAELSAKHEERMHLIISVCDLLKKESIGAGEVEALKIVLNILAAKDSNFALPSVNGFLNV